VGVTGLLVVNIGLSIIILLWCLYLLRKIRWIFTDVSSVREQVNMLADRDLVALHRGLVEHLQLSARLGGETLPPTRGWAASPDVLNVLVDRIEQTRPRRVLELGSGVSTLVIARALARVGQGHLYSLEHDAAHLRRTQDIVDRAGLADFVSLIHAPLTTRDDALWYGESRIPDGEFDLIFVDGPAMPMGSMIRFPAGPVLLPRLSSEGAMVVDDAARPDEQKAVETWRTQFPDLVFTEVPAEKGCVVISRMNPPAVADAAG